MSIPSEFSDFDAYLKRLDSEWSDLDDSEWVSMVALGLEVGND